MNGFLGVKKKTQVKQDIPTSSMPDVVFMLLFFFMVTTELRETAIDVQQRIPEATQLRKLLRKSLVTNLYIGEPRKTEQFGKEPKIQADDVFIEPKDIILWVNRQKDLLAQKLGSLGLPTSAYTTSGGCSSDFMCSCC